jgi:hypothetical protein
MAYITPLRLDRPPHSHRFDGFSPKLSRLLILFSFLGIVS